MVIVKCADVWIATARWWVALWLITGTLASLASIRHSFLHLPYTLRECWFVTLSGISFSLRAALRGVTVCKIHPASLGKHTSPTPAFAVVTAQVRGTQGHGDARGLHSKGCWESSLHSEEDGPSETWCWIKLICCLWAFYSNVLIFNSTYPVALHRKIAPNPTHKNYPRGEHWWCSSRSRSPSRMATRSYRFENSC